MLAESTANPLGNDIEFYSNLLKYCNGHILEATSGSGQMLNPLIVSALRNLFAYMNPPYYLLLTTYYLLYSHTTLLLILGRLSTSDLIPTRILLGNCRLILANPQLKCRMISPVRVTQHTSANCHQFSILITDDGLSQRCVF